MVAVQSTLAAQKIHIGILTDGPTQGFQQIHSLFIEEILRLTEGEFEVHFESAHQLDGNWSAEKIRAALQRLQQNDQVDIILALGFVSSLIAARSQTIPKPTFAPLVLDSNLLNLPRNLSGDGATSGIKNLNYLTEAVRFTDDLIAFREVVDYQQLALVVDQTVFESVAELAQQGSRWASETGIELTYVLNSAADENLADKIPGHVDAVMVAAIPRLSPAGRNQLIKELIRRNLPSYSLIGATAVEQGLLAASAPDSDWNRLARRNALNLQAVLLGGNPGDQPISFKHKRQLTINMDTARQIGVAPRFDVLSTAVLLNEDDLSGDTQWTLSTVAHESLKSNLDIQSSIAGVNVGSELERQAKSRIGPQFNTTVGLVQLDPDGGNVAVALNASQIIYSEASLANIEIQRLVQQARQSAHRAVELDIVQQATVGFLNILKSQTLIDIRRRALNLSRANLNLARDRVQLGSVTASDVYRWESEVATSRQSVLAARAQLNQAMDALNRILHRPIGERFKTVPASLADPTLMVSRQDLVEIIDNQKSFDKMGQLMIFQGKNNSPELKQLQYQIASAERQLVSNRKAYWSPQVSVAGQVSHTLDEHPNQGDSEWQISVNLSVPLYQGGARRSKVNQSIYELHQLNLQRESVEQAVELQVRQNLHAVQASYPAMELAQIAAHATEKNLELVQDNYAKGAVSISNFLNARDASLNVEQNAVNAVYDFLIDLMNLQRSTAAFDFFLDEQAMQRSVDEIKRYIATP
ncbi:TolC family protein [Candidatus Spongiihabitans sp.]|uniref:TolC family protein n=1 Tax=Candidatus Spongiihabitans sp. TaxID=3101308 RepID=UPI003C7B5408